MDVEKIELMKLCEIKKGKKVTILKHPTQNTVPYLLIDTLRGQKAEDFTEDKNYTEAIETDLLMVFDGANSGLVGTGLRGAVGSTIGRLRTTSNVDNKYLSYFLSLNFSTLNSDTKGTAIPHVKPRNLMRMKVRCPSITEQKQIVSELEKQFTRLDESVASLKKVKQKLGVYRKSVLKAAFDGKFTDNFVYDSVKLSQFDRKGGGTPSTKVKEYWNGDIYWITSANIDDKNRITYDKKITELGLKNSSTNRIPKNSVILVTRVGLGKVAVNEWDTAISQDCQGIICKDINPYYLMWHLKSIANEIILKGQGTTINGITINTLNELTVKIPNRNTQNTIVQEIESRFSIIEKLEKTVDGALQKSEMLRKSILKSAFEGKLVS